MKTKLVSYTLDDLPPLTDKDREELRALAARPDSEIDLTDPDAPELTDEQWANAVRYSGRYYRPNKAQITAKVDQDVIAWLKSGGRGYQTRMNAILRRAMLEERGTARKAG